MPRYTTNSSARNPKVHRYSTLRTFGYFILLNYLVTIVSAWSLFSWDGDPTTTIIIAHRSTRFTRSSSINHEPSVQHRTLTPSPESRDTFVPSKDLPLTSSSISFSESRTESQNNTNSNRGFIFTDSYSSPSRTSISDKLLPVQTKPTPPPNQELKTKSVKSKSRSGDNHRKHNILPTDIPKSQSLRTRNIIPSSRQDVRSLMPKDDEDTTETMILKGKKQQHRESPNRLSTGGGKTFISRMLESNSNTEHDNASSSTQLSKEPDRQTHKSSSFRFDHAELDEKKGKRVKIVQENDDQEENRRETIQKRSHPRSSSSLPSSSPSVSSLTSSFPDSISHDHHPTTGRDQKALAIDLENHHHSVLVRWILHDNVTTLSGFVVSYRMEGREHYDSSHLGSRVRSFSLHSLHEDKEYSICVMTILAVNGSHHTTPTDRGGPGRRDQNQGRRQDHAPGLGLGIGEHDRQQKEHTVEVCQRWSKPSSKMITGIIAGTTMMAPCFIVIIFIYFKDKLIKKKILENQRLDGLEAEELVKKETVQPANSKNNKSSLNGSDSGHGHGDSGSGSGGRGRGGGKTEPGLDLVSKIPMEDGATPGVSSNHPKANAEITQNAIPSCGSSSSNGAMPNHHHSLLIDGQHQHQHSYCQYENKK